MAESTSQSSDPAKGEELRDLVQRFMASLAEFSRRLPFDVDLQVPDFRPLTILFYFIFAPCSA